jgi:hypothetical protein
MVDRYIPAYPGSMNIEAAIDDLAFVENAAGPLYLTFPYTSDIGKASESSSVRVPIRTENPSEKDKTALAEAISLQGALGEWVLHDDGTAWLMSKA